MSETTAPAATGILARPVHIDLSLPKMWAAYLTSIVDTVAASVEATLPATVQTVVNEGLSSMHSLNQTFQGLTSGDEQIADIAGQVPGVVNGLIAAVAPFYPPLASGLLPMEIAMGVGTFAALVKTIAGIPAPTISTSTVAAPAASA